MSVDTELIRIIVARTVLSPARKIGGSYLCTMRAASEHGATDAVQAFLLCCGPFNFKHYPLINRVRDSAPDGSSPRDCAVLFEQWRIISIFFAFIHLCLVLREKFFPAPDGSYVLEEDIDCLMHLLYSK